MRNSKNKKNEGNIRIVPLGFMFVLFILLFSAFTIIEISKPASAFPKIAMEIYGNIELDGKAAPLGTTVSIYTSSGLKCGFIEVTSEGIYGLVSCKGDDLSTSTIEGAKNNEELVFYVNGRICEYKTNAANVRWGEGGFLEVNLTAKSKMQNENLPLQTSERNSNLNENEKLSPINNLEDTKKTVVEKSTDENERIQLLFFLAGISILSLLFTIKGRVKP